MILGAAALVLANAASFAGARALLKRLHREKAELLPILLLRLLLISTAMLAAGCASLLTPLALGVAAAAALAALRPRFGKPELRLGVWTWVLGGLVTARLLAQVWLFAPYQPDALSYHLPKIAEWVRAGGFTREMGPDSHASLPAGFELVETWWVVFLRHDVLIEMAGVEFLLLAFAATRSLGRSLGLSEPFARLAGLLYVTGPGMSLQSTSCLNDGATAALVVATAALLVERAPLALLAVPLGLGLGVKPTFAFALPGLILLGGWRGDRRGALRMAAWAGSVGAFWYARNLVWFGNPVHPVGSDVDLPLRVGAGFATLVENLRALFGEGILDAREAPSALLPSSAGWGAAAVSCGSIGLLALGREDRGFRRVAGAFGLSLLCALLLARPDPWNLRFVLFAPAALSLAAARLAESRPAVTAVVALALTAQFATATLPAEIPGPVLRRLVSTSWRARATPVADPPPGGNLAVFARGRRSVYPLYGPGFDRKLVYLRSRTPEELLEDFRRSGADTLYAAPDLDGEATLRACLLEGRLRRAGDRLFRIP